MNQKCNITALLYNKRGRLLSVGKNSYRKTHPIQHKFAKQVGQYNKVYLHAEVDALIRCRDSAAPYRMVIIRRGKRGDLRPSKPCRVCLAALESFGVQKLEYIPPTTESLIYHKYNS